MNKKVVITAVVLIVVALIAALFVVLRGKGDYQSEDYIWSASVDAKGGDCLVRGEKIDRIKNDVSLLLRALNRSDEDPDSFRTPAGAEPLGLPKLKLIDVTGNVVKVEVINDEFLTQRMGSTGAEAFLAEATFTLTEHTGIQFVNFVFKEGDHAMPGLYSRGTFLEERQWTIAK
ncbi:MAG: hypothetical protein R6W75_07740 [Smithellaceae bacterium]